ncbi:GNAT family N-acetyltransferase [Thalassotalea sp. 1_MG-2023]|uniref:GNAT family N-acetyltransferase n=1 Tax=Thalassotalea sp. 1_MG-2023 TaxID=3062680 RepID=UPI0026E3F664|nr:GNAT family N-acetyltransferase [Thalassotalea sp. 1_MG-2023]MDO6426870.1 GNAT family N-acetyltransferase [Thalassotalea sp. 1_MG-2023]
MKITINKATVDDANKIAPLFDLYRQFYQEASDINLAIDFLTARLSKGESTIYFAIDDANTVHGFTQLFPSFSSISAQATWILNDLFVIEESRGIGIGKLLLERAEKLAINSHAKGIGLETTTDNVSAQKLYESLGYEIADGYLQYFKTL